MTPEEAQELMKEATGFTPDAAVKDVSRCIYMVPEDHTKYVSPKLFEVTTSDDDSTTTMTTKTTFNGDNVSPQAELSKLSQLSSKENKDLSFKGIPYSSIISEWWRRNGGEPAEGERNVKLHKLAVNLRAICDNKKDVLMQVMPRFGLSDAELKSIVDSACKEEPKGISKMMNDIILSEELKVKNEEFASAHPELQLDDDAQSDSSLFTLHSSLRKALPIGLKDYWLVCPPRCTCPHS